MNLKTGPNDDMRRTDRILRKALPHYPLSLIHRLLRQGKILVSGKRVASNDRIPAGSLISIPEDSIIKREQEAGSREQGYCVPHDRENNKKRSQAIPHSLISEPRFQVQILLQNDELLILNKPAGLAVHGPESLDTQVQSYLAQHLLKPENSSLSFRPGPLHRLDKPTSGIIVFSKSLKGARNFSSLMREGKIQKQYLAIAEGCIDKPEIWHDQLARDKTRKITTVLTGAGENTAVEAHTSVRPLAVSIAGFANQFTLIAVQIHTGRTHQIRAQAAAHGCPLMGDVKYGGRKTPVINAEGRGQNAGKGSRNSFFLHAWKLQICGDAEICAPLPLAFQEMIKALFGAPASF